MSIDKSKHVFGSESDVDFALEHGLIDAYDILFLSDGKVGWIDWSGNKVIHKSKKQVVSIDKLPEKGDTEVLYIYNSQIYIWSDDEYFCLSSGGGIDLVAQPDPPSDTSVLWIDTDDNDNSCVREIVNDILDHEKVTDDEILELLIKEDFLPAVTDSDGSLLADENNNVLLW